jgi:hypothetical protein
MKHEDRIHLVREVPDKGRAKSFCGAILRKGLWFDTPARVLKLLSISHTSHYRAVYTKQKRGNTLQYYAPTDYAGNICPNCTKSEEYALALLANVP